jgi:hypothetical protein
MLNLKFNINNAIHVLSNKTFSYDIVLPNFTLFLTFKINKIDSAISYFKGVYFIDKSSWHDGIRKFEVIDNINYNLC